MNTEEKRVLLHESTVRRALWPPIVMMGLLALLLFGLVWQVWYSEQWVEHSNVVILRVSRAMRFSVDMETGKRGYLLAGDRALLQPYEDSGEQVDAAYKNLLDIVSDNPSQHQRAASMYAAFKIWREEADEQIAATKYNPAMLLEKRFDDLPGKEKMDRVRIIFKLFLDEEAAKRRERVHASEIATKYAPYVGGTLLVVTGFVLAFLTRSQMRELSDQYETVLNAESRVRERLATTLISIGDGVLVTDRKGNITLLNPVAEQLTGWTQDEAQGKPSAVVFDITHEVTGERVPSPIEQAIRENQSVLLANHTMLKRRDGTMIAIEDSASPVRDKRGDVSGVVLVFRDVTERKQKEAELAAALEKNSRIAETLQRSMLITPPADAFAGLSLATLYEPAWDEAQVGGDFYDAFTFWENKVALVVGDATGKGLAAAATVSEVKYALRAFLYEDKQPGRALNRLNQFLANTERVRAQGVEAAPFSFISMALVVIDTNTGLGSCAVAGAEPPLLVKTDGATREAGDVGMMLGASPDSEYDETAFQLQHGDLLVFTTDGVTEARRGKKEFFGYDGFTRAVRSATQETPTELAEIAVAVVAEAKSYAGGRLKDDVCLLVAKRS